MSLRTRLSVAVAGAMAAAIAIASVLIYVAVRNQLRDQIDRALQERAEQLTVFSSARAVPFSRAEARFPAELPPPRFGGASGLTQLVLSDGSVIQPSEQQVEVPASRETVEVAAGNRAAFFADATAEGKHLRVLTVQIDPGIALQIARPLDEVDDFLRRMIIILGAVIVGGTASAAALARLVARPALSPVADLTEAAEKVAETKDLSHRIDREGTDEIGRLASSFNAMLEALDHSLKAQRQLVADASHELRTPMTSLRTNIEVLTRGDDLSDLEKEKLIADVVGQLDELTVLIGDLIELARGDEPDVEMDEVRLDLAAERAIEKSERHWPRIRFVSDLRESTVPGVASRLERAISNLLDNAAKWSPVDGEVSIEISGGEARVRDRGPGIAEEDLPHIFDRFYRASDARAMSGSGIGLAIVRQVAQSHGGSVTAENAEGGGAMLILKLPEVS